MSLHTCPKCWDYLCTCGYEYQDMSLSQLKNKRDSLESALLQVKSLILDKQDAEFARLDEPGRR